MGNQPFTHILQKKGILKSFSVAKVVKEEDIKELQALIKSVTSSEKEYKQILKEELVKLSDMHDKDNPIPGIIYPSELFLKRQMLFTIANKLADNIKKQKFSKSELALLISAMISRLELTQDDFTKLNEDLQKEQENDED